MHQRSRERRLPAELTDETVFIRPISCRYGHLGALLLFTDWENLKLFEEDRLASRLHDARDRSHLTVAIDGDVVHEEVDQAAFLLQCLSLIHISEPTRLGMISYAVFCLKKKK